MLASRTVSSAESKDPENDEGVMQFPGVLSTSLRADRLPVGNVRDSSWARILWIGIYSVNIVGMFRLRAWDSGIGRGIEALRST